MLEAYDTIRPFIYLAVGIWILTKVWSGTE